MPFLVNTLLVLSGYCRIRGCEVRGCWIGASHNGVFINEQLSKNNNYLYKVLHEDISLSTLMSKTWYLSFLIHYTFFERIIANKAIVPYGLKKVRVIYDY